jgi:hypothetical protein
MSCTGYADAVKEYPVNFSNTTYVLPDTILLDPTGTLPSIPKILQPIVRPIDPAHKPPSLMVKSSLFVFERYFNSNIFCDIAVISVKNESLSSPLDRHICEWLDSQNYKSVSGFFMPAFYKEGYFRRIFEGYGNYLKDTFLIQKNIKYVCLVSCQETVKVLGPNDPENFTTRESCEIKFINTATGAYTLTDPVIGVGSGVTREISLKEAEENLLSHLKTQKPNL